MAEKTDGNGGVDRTEVCGGGSDLGEATLFLAPGIDGPPPWAETLPDARLPQGLTGLSARFQVRGVLGQGGMGVVLDAHDPSMRRDVAVKTIRGEWSDRQVMRFLAEAQIQGQLEHPGVCPIHELGEDASGRPWFAMKKIHGRSLRARLSELREGSEGTVDPFPLGQRVDTFRRIGETMAFAHARGVIHRDLKPDNVMLGSFGEVQVMDWGLARVLDRPDMGSTAVATDRAESGAGASVEGSVLGTPAYMSPEQARGALQDVGVRSDVYSLGVLLYELLTLQPAFTGSRDEVIDRVKSGVFAPPRSVDVRVPLELEAVVQKAMAQDPDHRYHSVSDLLADVDAWREGRIVGAVRYSVGQRLLKWLQQHRTAVLAVGAAVLVAATTASLIWWQGRQQSAEDAQRRHVAWRQSATFLARRLVSANAQAATWSRPDAPQLMLPNGERDEEILGRFYVAQERVLEAAEALSLHAKQWEPGFSRDGLAAELLTQTVEETCDRAARTAAEVGDMSLARTFVNRHPTDRVALLRVVEEIQERRRSEDLAVVDRLMVEAGNPKSMSPSFLDFATTEIVRRGEPAVVRRLLEVCVPWPDSEWQRRLVIECLGRLGDTRTEGPDGRDAVELLVNRLQDIDLEADREEGVALVTALAFLGDARAFEAVFEKRWDAGATSVFWDRTQVAATRIPRPDSAAVLDRTADAWVSWALRQESAGDLDGAILAYGEALKVDPQLDDAWVNRGTLHLRSGRAAEAESDQTAAIAINPENPNPWYNRGNARLSLGRPLEAKADFEKAIALRDGMAVAWDGLGRTWVRLNQPSEAVRCYDAALERDPENAVTLNNRGIARSFQGDLEGAVRDYTEAIRIRPEPTLAFLNRGRAHLDLGHYEEAAADLDEALRQNPREVRAYLARGTLHRLSRDYPAALTDVGKALELDPTNGPAWEEQARCYLAQNDQESALSSLSQGLQHEPDAVRLWDLRGQVRYGMGDAGADEDFTQGVERAPNYWPVRYNRALTRFHRDGVAGARRALADLEVLVEQEPARASCGILRVKALLVIGEDVRALASAETLTECFPDEGDAFALLARARFRHFRKSENPAELDLAAAALQRAAALGAELNQDEIQELRSALRNR